MNELLVLVAVAIISAGVAAAVTVGTTQLGARGERRRFEAELAPLRAAITEIADRFDHWTKRERRRDFVSVQPTGNPAVQTPPGSSEPGLGPPATRAARLAAFRRTMSERARAEVPR